MTRTVVLAALLGVIVGVVVGYSPFVQPSNAPSAQLLMQQAGNRNSVSPTFRPAPSPAVEPLLIAVLAGLVIATPVFLFARHRAY